MTFYIQKGWLRKGYELVGKGPETVQISASIYGKLLEDLSTERLHIVRKGSEFVMLWKVFGKNFWFGQKGQARKNRTLSIHQRTTGAAASVYMKK